MTHAQLLARVRKLALAYPETDEASPFGDPWFRVRGKMFTLFSVWNGQPCIAVKVGKEHLPLFLEDPRFFQTPYIGRGGWVCLLLDKAVDWEEVAELIRDSFNRVAPKRLQAGLAPESKSARPRSGGR
jgi:predicted DNA-binding protein (MmcQ/YjbR family)